MGIYKTLVITALFIFSFYSTNAFSLNINHNISSNTHEATFSNFNPSSNIPSDKKHNKSHWIYTGSKDPNHWGKLVSEYSLCSTKKKQAPINIEDSKRNVLLKLNSHCQSVPTSILNNHPIQTHNNLFLLNG